MVCDVDGTLYRIDVDHLHAKRLLQFRSRPVYPRAAIAAGVGPACILFNLDQPRAVFVDYHKIDRATSLRGGEDPVSQPQEILGANQFAHVAVDMSLVRQGSPTA